MMASAALAQNSYRIAKSWQYQEKLPDVFLEKDIAKGSHYVKDYQDYGTSKGNQIEHTSTFSFHIQIILNITNY